VAAVALPGERSEGSRASLQPACITPVLEGIGGAHRQSTCGITAGTVINCCHQRGNTVLRGGSWPTSHCELRTAPWRWACGHSPRCSPLPDRAVDLFANSASGAGPTTACSICTRCVRVCDGGGGRPRSGTWLAGEHCGSRRARSALGERDACTDCASALMRLPYRRPLFPGDTVEEKARGFPASAGALLRAPSSARLRGAAMSSPLVQQLPEHQRQASCVWHRSGWPAAPRCHMSISLISME